MNAIVLNRVTADGNEYAVEVPRGYALSIHPISNDCTIRSTSGSTNGYFTVTGDSYYTTGRSYGQTLYITATAGTVIELMKV